MGRRNLLAWVAAAAAALTLSCGGGGPSSPSGTGVEVQGVVLSGATAVIASSGSHPAAKPQKVTVTVEGTTITAEVAADGTFVLKGIPGGDFTLVFMVDGAKIGGLSTCVINGGRKGQGIEDGHSRRVQGPGRPGKRQAQGARPRHAHGLHHHRGGGRRD